MLINETHFIDSCDDVELNIKRTNKLEYKITYDDSKKMKAIVFIVDGYGANVNMSIVDFNRRFVSQKFDVVAVSVIYHCYCARKSSEEKYGAQTFFTNNDLPYLKYALKQFNIKCDDLDIYSASDYFEKLNKYIDKLKDQNMLDENYKLYLTSTIIPLNNEYQNYGIMAAIDIINVLKDLIKNYSEFNTLPKIYGGLSYGGYLSLMCAKIAPWYVDGIIDNSGEALLLLNYIIGRDLNEPEFMFYEKNFIINIFLKTYWTRKDPNSPYYFADENYLIRTLLNKEHLILQYQKNKNIRYICYHSSKDILTPYNDKVKLIDVLKLLGFNITFHSIDEKDIDNKFIKNLNHGCGISVKALFNKELPKMLEKLKDKTFNIKEDSISYPCKNKVFTFKDKDNKFVLEIK